MKVAMIGCGGLGEALVRGVLRDDDVTVVACDRNAEKRAALEGPRVTTTDDAELAVARADVVVIAVKPKAVAALCLRLDGAVSNSAVVVSCAAGIPLATLDAALPSAALARAMPNIGAAVGAGTTALVLGPRADAARDLPRLERLFAAVGRARVVVDEQQLHAITAVAASGPAFVLLAIEALVEAGIEAGLARSDALFYARGAAVAAAGLLDRADVEPSMLRAQVTSPAGTTIAGIAALERAAVRGAYMDAVREAVRRSRALADDAAGKK
jgi:pyrroline-5-carboxylate reductase